MTNLEARTLANATDADLARWQAENLAHLERPNQPLSYLVRLHDELRTISAEITRRASRQTRMYVIAAAAACLAWCFLGFALGHYVARSTCQQVEVTR